MPTGHRGWPRAVWDNPLPHDFTWGFGLTIDDSISTKSSTIIPTLMQDNAIIDYETIKTNKENDDFAVVAKPNTAAGSYVPKVVSSWTMVLLSSEPGVLNLYHMPIGTSMLNRLDAFDKKTGNDIETILELTHEVTDEQCFPLWNGVKLFEGHHVSDLPAEVPGLTGTQQVEGVAFDQEMFFDALHYYTNREMLRKVTGRMELYKFGASVGQPEANYFERVKFGRNSFVPSLCKYQHPYTFCGELFHAPKTGTAGQPDVAGSVTAIEHVSVYGRTRFMEYNPDFNFSRA